MSATGLCECGCGQTTAVLTRNKPPYRKGDHRRFVNAGHARRRPLTSSSWTIQDRGHDTPCWIWQGRTRDGYGRVLRDGHETAAHRLVYEQRVGPIPEGLLLDHLCRVPSCVNPAHLEPVTLAENTRRGASTKLTDEQAHEIRTSDLPGPELARRYCISRTHVNQIKDGTWRAAA